MNAICFKVLLVVWFIARLSSLPTTAQIVNDGIQNRSELILDGDYISSSTNYNSVEWACVNKAMTHKCIEYHNDQWFTFSVPASGKYYLNISSQVCRDARGIQALILEGNPCEIKTYKVLQCIAQIRQQDIFIELDSIKSNEKYLVNIDGFLGDFCTFNIQLSSKPGGLNLHAENLDTLKFTTHLMDKMVTLEWEVEQRMANELKGFEIQRRYNRNLKPAVIGNVWIERNALGTAQVKYSLSDTVSTDGMYYYDILGIFDDGVKEILSQQILKFYSPPKPRPLLTLDVSLDYKKGTPVLVLVMNKGNGKLLKKLSFEFNKMYNAEYSIPVEMYAAMGIRIFLVRCVNQRTHEEIDYAFEITENNEVLRK